MERKLEPGDIICSPDYSDVVVMVLHSSPHLMIWWILDKQQKVVIDKNVNSLEINTEDYWEKNGWVKKW